MDATTQAPTRLGFAVLQAVFCVAMPAVYKKHPEASVKGFPLVGNTPLNGLEKAARSIAEHYLSRKLLHHERAAEFLTTIDSEPTFGEVILTGIRRGHICVIFPKGNAGPLLSEIYAHEPGTYVNLVLSDLVKEFDPWLQEFGTQVAIEYKNQPV